MKERPSKTVWYLNIAKAVSERSTCIRRDYGAIIVLGDRVVSTGYPGTPRGVDNCADEGVCPRKIANIPSGQNYDMCGSVHAEENAIINAASIGISIEGGTMYIYGIDKENNNKPITAKPCSGCKRKIINAKLEKVIIADPEIETGFTEIYANDLIREENKRNREIREKARSKSL